MFQYLAMWFLANYSYENIMGSYTAYTQGNPIREMSEFIDKQQFREDQLREHCLLDQYKIKERPTTIEAITESVTGSARTMVSSVYTYQQKLIGLTIPYANLILPIGNRLHIPVMDKIVVDSIEQLITQSYLAENMNRVLVYKGVSYTLHQVGTHTREQAYYDKGELHLLDPIDPIDPVWIISLNGLTHTITNIK